MESNDSANQCFLYVLKNLKPFDNPFNDYKTKLQNHNCFETNYFGFKEDLYDFEIRCPICYQRVKSAVRPEHCYHVFCNYCLKKWAKRNKICPYCRKKFQSIYKVDYSESWVIKNYS